MKKLKSLAVGTVCLILCMFAASLATSKPAPAAPPLPSVPVTVVNNPLPVQGTVNANVSGTVAVSSLPAVTLSGTPSVNLSTSPAAPLYVDTDRSARNSFTASCDTSNYDPVSGQASCSIFTIPAGRQVVIESVSCTAEVAAGQGPGQADLIIPNIPYGAAPTSAQGYYFPLAMSRQAGNGVDIWAITTPMRASGAAPTGGSVNIGVFFRASLPNLNPPQGMSCTIGGYVVPQ